MAGVVHYSFAAIRDVAESFPDPVWQDIRLGGLDLIRKGRFGRFGLPPDWLAVDTDGGHLFCDPSHEPRFSYDACRVPLHLAWAGLGREPAVADAAAFWGHAAVPPAWADLETGVEASVTATAGQQAIALLAGPWSGVRPPPRSRRVPSVGEAGDYYSAALILLARLAFLECPPPGAPGAGIPGN